MIEEKLIEEELYKKYIEPTKKKRNDYIGIEIEIPILNCKKQAVNFQTVFEVTDQFMKELFLNPLYERIQNHTNPAKVMLEHIEQGGNLESVIESYGKL